MSPLLPANWVSQTEECQTVPARTGDRNRDRTEGRVVPIFIPEPLCEHLHQNGASFPFPAEQSSGQRQTAIPIPTIQNSSRHLNGLAFNRQKVSASGTPASFRTA